jgi:hypothetical protein
MRRLVLLLLITVSQLLFVQVSCADSLTVVQGRILFASHNGEYKELFRTSSPFYGYGWLDEDEVFLAYQPDGEAEAFAVIETFNLRLGTKKKITVIGGAGESHFASNSKLREIIFNDSEGLRLMSIEKNGKHKISTILGDNSVFAPFWIDEDTVGYLKNNKLEKVTIKRKCFKP